MLYNLLYPLANEIQALNLFKYLTFRSGGAMLTALIISFLIGGRIIRWLKKWQKEGQPIRDDGPESHLETKKGTPTMGGIMILVSVFISTILWADVKNPYIWITIFVTVAYGLLGFMDDYLKVKKRNSKGVRAKAKLMGQMIVALVACLFVQKAMMPDLVSSTSVPFFKSIYLDLGYFYAVFVMLVVVGSSNAVNLTDGLDGLAIVPIAIAAASFGFIAYLVGNVKYAEYLHIPYVADSGEIAVFCAALVGASLGFFWYNSSPAQVFMGDTGSLALGGALGIISVIVKHEIVLAIIGGLFVAEAVSVMLQVASFKTTGKRIFKMAPLHHHFEKLGWKETKVVARFWIVAVIFALVGLSTLKIR